MTKTELNKLVKQGENQRISLKALKVKPSTLARPMVSFSNTNDGLIIVGVDDKIRQIDGAKTPREKEECLDNIHNAAKQCCDPEVSISRVEEVNTPEGIVFVVFITKDSDEVYVTDGAVFVRKGTMDVRPSNYEIQLLFSKRNKLKFEGEVVEDASVDDIDFDKISEFRAEYLKNRNKRLSNDDMGVLKQFGCMKKSRKKDIPTVAGILCFGKIPQQFFSFDYIHIFRYGTTEKDSGAKISDCYIDGGSLLEMISEAYNFITESLGRELIPYKNPQTGKREYIPKYPYLVIREAIANAVTHREYSPFIRNGIDIFWYSDRIEIINPGLFLDPITPENIYTERNRQRNPDIAKILTGYGYAEQAGEGMMLFRRECENHPLKPKHPEYKELTDAVVTILYPAKVMELREEKELPEGLNERQKKAVDYIKEKGRITNREYSEINKIGRVYAFKELSDLVSKKVFKQIGKGRSTYYVMSD